MGNCQSATSTTASVQNGPKKPALPKQTPVKASVKPSKKPKPASPSTANRNFVYRKGTCALEYWEPVKLIGEGSISSIHLVQRRDARIDVPYQERADVMRTSKTKQPQEQPIAVDPDKPVYALKSIMKDHVENDVFLQEMRNEIYTMSRLNHPNVIQVYEAYERKRHIYLIMEYCRGGDLLDVSLTEERTQEIVRQLLQAVAYLHKHKVVHRDLKLENIMFADEKPNAQVKIIDFGLATRYLSDEYRNMTDRVGTVYTMAPQVLQGVYDSKCDLWSIGVITYILLCGEQPFWGPRKEMPWAERRKVMVDRIMRCQYMRMKGGVWDGVSREAKVFVKSLLHIDPEKRPSAARALRSTWMLKQYTAEDAEHDHPALADQVSRYSKEAKLKRLALTTIAYKSTADEIEELRAVFEKYDTDKEGHISYEHFRDALSSSKLSESDITFIFSEMDMGGTGYLEYNDFIAATLETRGRVETERIAEAFDRLDVDKTGTLSKKNLRNALGENVSDHVLTEILEEVDNQEEGEVSYSTFMGMFGRKNASRIRAMSNHEGDDEFLVNSDLVDAKNAVIPGGRNDPSTETKYVYDRNSNSVRRCDSSEINTT